MKEYPLYKQIAGTLLAIANCEKSGNVEWLAKHKATLKEYADDCLPSGSGIDSGTEIDEASTPERIVLNLSYHHMNETGFYDGWTEHRIIVTPSLYHGFTLRITGRNRNDIKDCLYEVYQRALSIPPDCATYQESREACRRELDRRGPGSTCEAHS